MAKISGLKEFSDRATDGEALSPMDRRIKRKLISPQTLGIGLTILVLIVLAGYVLWQFGLNRSLTVDTDRIEISPVRYGLFREYIPVTGNVAPRETVYLDAIEGGQVTRVYVDEGEMVGEGAALLELKNTNLQLEVISTETRLTEQVANLNFARIAFQQSRLNYRRELLAVDERTDALQRDIARMTPLVEQRVLSRAELEDLEAELAFSRERQETIESARGLEEQMQRRQIEQLETAVKRISDNLDIVRDNLANLVMKAPIAGQLTIFEANLGESKSPGQRVGQVDDISHFKVTALVDEFYLGRIHIGQQAKVAIGNRDHVLAVTKVYPNVRNRQFEVDLAFEGDVPDSVRRGQTLRMELEIGAQSESLILDNGPYVDETGGKWVYALSADGAHAVRRDIAVGRRNPHTVEIVRGLEAGERVITSSYEHLEKFDTIKLR